MKLYVAIVSLLLALPGAAKAQVVTNLDPTQIYVPVLLSTGVIKGFCGLQFCINPSQGIPLSFFAQPNLQPQIDSLSGQINAVTSQISRLQELTAIAASMGDAIPNPGDRFAIRINASEFEGQVGGSLGVSYLLTDRARLSINYGQGRSQSVFGGGLNLSFR